jgi:hypothetical protein
MKRRLMSMNKMGRVYRGGKNKKRRFLLKHLSYVGNNKQLFAMVSHTQRSPLHMQFLIQLRCQRSPAFQLRISWLTFSKELSDHFACSIEDFNRSNDTIYRWFFHHP